MPGCRRPRRRARRTSRRSSTAIRALAPLVPARRRLPRRVRRATSSAGRTGASACPTSSTRWSPSSRSSTGSTASVTSSSSRCTRRTGRANRLGRGGAGRGDLAGVHRRARDASTRTSCSCRSASSTSRPATTPTRRCCSPRPSRCARSRRSPGARSSRTARPPASAAWCARQPRSPSSTCPTTPRGMLDDQALTEQTFVMWDLIHDRTHMRGDLPFDPFMIKQRMPYFLYSLEELRCDLTAFRECVAIQKRLRERSTRSDARRRRGRDARARRLVQYAVIFDRIFRFAITGTRVRNYDGARRPAAVRLAAPARRAALDRHVARLRLGRGAGAVVALGDAIDELYWRSIDRPEGRALAGRVRAGARHADAAPGVGVGARAAGRGARRRRRRATPTQVHGRRVPAVDVLRGAREEDAPGDRVDRRHPGSGCLSAADRRGWRTADRHSVRVARAHRRRDECGRASRQRAPCSPPAPRVVAVGRDAAKLARPRGRACPGIRTEACDLTDESAVRGARRARPRRRSGRSTASSTSSADGAAAAASPGRATTDYRVPRELVHRAAPREPRVRRRPARVRPPGGWRSSRRPRSRARSPAARTTRRSRRRARRGRARSRRASPRARGMPERRCARQPSSSA